MLSSKDIIQKWNFFAKKYDYKHQILYNSHMELREKLKTAILIAEAIKHHFGGNTWVVGGFLREALQENEPKDIDLATDIPPEEILTLDGEIYKETRIQAIPMAIEHGTVLIKTEEETFEITTLRKDVACDGRHATVEFTKNIEEDLARRDFTVNAMALDLLGNLTEEEIIDPFGGREDLKNGLVKAVGNPEHRFLEDHLRMMRACRFIAKLGWVEGKTGTAISKLSYKCANLSKERIREEILKMMKQEDIKTALNCMWVWKFFPHTIPPMEACIGVPGGPHHEETVLEHCIDACQAIPKEKPLLRLAALLHDCGKPQTAKDGTFLQHENIGAEIAETYLKEFKFTNEEVEYVTCMIRHHMFHFDLDTHKRAIKKWLTKINGRWEDLILLRQADRVANKAKKDLPLTTAYMQDLMNKIREIEEFKEPMKVTDLKISGKDLVEMGLTPGPLFGKILNSLLEDVLENPEKNDKEQLLLEVRKLLQPTLERLLKRAMQEITSIEKE